METIEALVRTALYVLAFAVIFLVPGAGLLALLGWKVWQRAVQKRAPRPAPAVVLPLSLVEDERVVGCDRDLRDSMSPQE